MIINGKEIDASILGIEYLHRKCISFEETVNVIYDLLSKMGVPYEIFDELLDEHGPLVDQQPAYILFDPVSANAVKTFIANCNSSMIASPNMIVELYARMHTLSYTERDILIKNTLLAHLPTDVKNSEVIDFIHFAKGFFALQLMETQSSDKDADVRGVTTMPTDVYGIIALTDICLNSTTAVFTHLKTIIENAYIECKTNKNDMEADRYMARIMVQFVRTYLDKVEKDPQFILAHKLPMHYGMNIQKCASNKNPDKSFFAAQSKSIYAAMKESKKESKSIHTAMKASEDLKAIKKAIAKEDLQPNESSRIRDILKKDAAQRKAEINRVYGERLKENIKPSPVVNTRKQKICSVYTDLSSHKVIVYVKKR